MTFASMYSWLCWVSLPLWDFWSPILARFLCLPLRVLPHIPAWPVPACLIRRCARKDSPSPLLASATKHDAEWMFVLTEYEETNTLTECLEEYVSLTTSLLKQMSWRKKRAKVPLKMKSSGIVEVSKISQAFGGGDPKLNRRAKERAATSPQANVWWPKLVDASLVGLGCLWERVNQGLEVAAANGEARGVPAAWPVNAMPSVKEPLPSEMIPRATFK